MKKLFASIFTVVLVTFGMGAAASAQSSDDIPEFPTEEQLGVLCAESDDWDQLPADIREACEIFLEIGSYPPLLPEEGTTPAPTPPPTPPEQPLPATGSDSTSNLLYAGGILLAGGIIVMVIARRRSPAAA